MTPFENHPNPKRMITRARLAYELGGVLLGLRVAWPVLPLSFFSWSCCGAQAIPVGLGILLFVLSVGLVSRGGEVGRAVGPGLLAGSLCAVLPISFKLLQLCSIAGCRSISQFCIYGGLLAGATLGYQAGRLESGRPVFLGVAGGIAALAGALGCVVAGLAGVVGMALGVLCASTPFLIAARAR